MKLLHAVCGPVIPSDKFRVVDPKVKFMWQSAGRLAGSLADLRPWIMQMGSWWPHLADCPTWWSTGAKWKMAFWKVTRSGLNRTGPWLRSMIRMAATCVFARRRNVWNYMFVEIVWSPSSQIWSDNGVIGDSNVSLTGNTAHIVVAIAYCECRTGKQMSV
jgi:hypothetical protein